MNTESVATDIRLKGSSSLSGWRINIQEHTDHSSSPWNRLPQSEHVLALIAAAKANHWNKVGRDSVCGYPGSEHAGSRKDSDSWLEAGRYHCQNPRHSSGGAPLWEFVDPHARRKVNLLLAGTLLTLTLSCSEQHQKQYILGEHFENSRSLQWCKTYTTGAKAGFSSGSLASLASFQSIQEEIWIVNLGEHKLSQLRRECDKVGAYLV